MGSLIGKCDVREIERNRIQNAGPTFKFQLPNYLADRVEASYFLQYKGGKMITIPLIALKNNEGNEFKVLNIVPIALKEVKNGS